MSACPRRPFADVKQRQQHLINPWSHQKSGPLRYSQRSANLPAGSTCRPTSNSTQSFWSFTLNPLPDPYGRNWLPLPPIEATDPGEPLKYLVDRILRKEYRRQPGDKKKHWYCRVRRQGYTAKDDLWVQEDILRENVPDIVRDFDRREEATVSS